MSTETQELDMASAAMQKFAPTDTAIAEMSEQYLPLQVSGIDDVEGLKAVHSARLVVKSHRVQVERVRKELKADSLAYGRRVDGEAKRITALLVPIEQHLSDQENAVVAEKERIKNAARLKVEAEAKAAADKEEARLKAIQEAEDARLKAEADRLAEERRQIDEERRVYEAEARAESDRLNGERLQIEAEKKQLADDEIVRLRKIENERIRKEAAETARIETEQRIAREAAEEKAEAEKAKADAAEDALRAEAIRPDRVKIESVADTIKAIVVPQMSDDARDAHNHVMAALADAAAEIRDIANCL